MRRTHLGARGAGGARTALPSLTPLWGLPWGLPWGLLCALLCAPLCALLCAPAARATPRMSLTAGTPCVGCHFSPNGGGGRTELGWGAMSKVGALTYDQLALAPLHAQESNTLLDGQLSVGFDARLQWARLGGPEYGPTGAVVYPDLTMIPMQLQPYLAVKPTHDLTLYGSFQPGSGLRDGDPLTQVYPGMSAFEAWGMYSLGGDKPYVRVGLFQPTFGVREDDHTILVRGDAANRRVPVIPPNFRELGVEVGYQPRRWLRAEVGVFEVRHLNESLNREGTPQLPGVLRNSNALWPVAAVARVTALPQFTFGGAAAPKAADEFADDFADDFGAPSAPAAPPAPPVTLNAWVGGSAYASGDFLMLNGFAGAGLSGGLSVVAEAMWSKRTIMYRQLNTHFGLKYALRDWAVLGGRVERAQTHSTTTLLDEVAVTWQYVAGVELFVLPYLEVRPEYRLVDNFDHRFGQATVQVHLFY